MKDIIIVGAGHLGLDVHSLICEINDLKPIWNILGFINDIQMDLSRFKLPIGIIGTIDGWKPSPNEFFAMAIGSPLGREKVANKLTARGAIFPTLISPRAKVYDSATIGEGSIIFGDSTIGPCATLGKFTCIGHSTSVGTDSVIGDYSNTALRVNVYQNVKIGRRCQIWSHSVVLNKIGDDAMVGAGSVVIAPVRVANKVLGNPARVIGRTDEEL